MSQLGISRSCLRDQGRPERHTVGVTLAAWEAGTQSIAKAAGNRSRKRPQWALADRRCPDCYSQLSACSHYMAIQSC
jgi:hypothetical protein